MCMVEDADPWAVVRTTRPRARKPHRCGECGRVIEPGEHYERTEGITGGYGAGQAACHKVCEHCAVLGSWLIALCNGFIFGAVLDDVAEHLRDGIGGGEVARAWAWARFEWGSPHHPVVVRDRRLRRAVERTRGAGLRPVPAPLPVPREARWAA